MNLSEAMFVWYIFRNDKLNNYCSISWILTFYLQRLIRMMDVSCSQRDMILCFMLYLLNKSNTSNKKLKQYSFMKWNDKENEEKVVNIFKILSDSLDFFSVFFTKKWISDK